MDIFEYFETLKGIYKTNYNHARTNYIKELWKKKISFIDAAINALNNQQQNEQLKHQLEAEQFKRVKAGELALQKEIEQLKEENSKLKFFFELLRNDGVII